MKEFIYTFKSAVGALALTLLCLGNTSAQSIKGIVKDNLTNEPLPGATIQVQSGKQGAATDAEGRFTVNASKGDVLLVSYVGYNPKTIKIGRAHV